MTESKPPTQSRLLRPGGIVANPPAPVPPYTPAGQYQLMPPRAKLNPVTQSSVAAATTIQHSLISTAVSTRFHVPLQIGSTKTPLIMSTSYKPNLGGLPAGPRLYSGHASIEKMITTPLGAAHVDTHVKANVKSSPVPKVSYVKQITSTIGKPTLSSVPVPNVVQAPIKKDVDIGKSVPVLLGPGLRQPLKSHQPQVTKTSLYGDSPLPSNITRLPVHSSNSWIIHQQDATAVSNTSSSSATVPRTKPPFQNNTVTAASLHALSNKHSTLQQPKSTISIMPTLSNIPPSEAIHRNTALSTVPTLSTGNKPIYQVVTPGFQTQIHGQNNAIKKLPAAMIVSQAISSTATGFASPAVLTSGQITVMTCGAGITYVPAPTPPNGTNASSIPIAKVYPQQQPAVRVSVTSASSRLSVPVISSMNAASLSSAVSSRTTPALLQVGPIKSTPTTSTVMTTQTTIVSTIPVAVNKCVANTGIGSVLCWPTNLNYTPQLPISTAVSGTPLRQNLILTTTPNQQNLQVAAAIRVQQNVLTTHLQGSGGAAPSLLQVTDTNRGSAPHNPTNQTSGGPTTPTMSPKPAILRRQRPDSSSAHKKLSFSSTSSSFQSQRRDFHSKPTDRRSAPYHINRQKISNNVGDTKDIPLVIPSGGNQIDKSEAKLVLPNQVYGKQIIPSNGFTPLKVNSIKAHTAQFSNSAKDGGGLGQSYSIHPVNIDLKVKMEPGPSLYSTTPQQHPVKPESSSASQMLHFQHQSMHTYAAESPQLVSNVPHRIVTQASGQHIRTNTIFTKPMSHPHYPGQQRPKSTQVIKSVPNATTASSVGSTGTPQQQPYLPTGPVNHGMNSFLHHRMRQDPNHPGERISAFDHIKKEPQPRTKILPNPEQTKTSVDNIISIHNHAPPNHLIPAISPAKLWSNLNNTDPLAGLSPRKRPRKQTHVVSEDPPEVVMEDEESTDDADECEDEPMSDVLSHPHNVSTTPSAKLPGHKPTALHHRQPKSEPPSSNKKPMKEENSHKSSYIKSEPSTSPTISESKPLSEYTDCNGVRYVASRKRPSVAVLNKLKPNNRPISNHYLHYSDIRVKDKKTTVNDLASEKKRLKGLKVARLALQLRDMVESENEVWERMQSVYNGLIEYKSSLVGDATFESNLASPSPSTPTSSLSNSFRKATPRSSRSSSLSAITENGGPMNSPTTPLDRRAHKVKDEISNIEELAQANLQRCRVVSDQILDTKTMLLKSIDHRQLVREILESPSSNQKTQSHTPSTPQSTKRMPKKKNNS